MANKTKFTINMAFPSSVQAKTAPLRTIQKGADPGKVGVSVTDSSCTCKSVVLHWDETTDPINKTVTLAIKEVTVDLDVTCAIFYAKEVDRKSPCYAHLVKHEYKHLASRKASVKKYKPLVVKFIEESVWPTLDDPQTMKSNKAKALRNSAYKKIKKAADDACGKFMTLSDRDSKKIDTSSETAETTRLCAEFI